MAKYRKRNISYSNQRQSRAQSRGPIEIATGTPTDTEVTDVEGINECCDCKDCLLRAIMEVESGDWNNPGSKDPMEMCNASAGGGAGGCGHYQIFEDYITDARCMCPGIACSGGGFLNCCDGGEACCGIPEDAHDILCNECNTEACCQEKKALAELIIDCWFRRYSRNQGKGNCGKDKCDGHGDAEMDGHGCLTCSDIAMMHKEGRCGHKCCENNNECCCNPPTCPDNPAEGGNACGRANQYWGRVKSVMCSLPGCSDCSDCGDGDGGDGGEVISKEEEKSMDIPDDAVGSCCFFDRSDQSMCKDGMCYGQCKELKGCWNEGFCEDRIMNGESLCCNDCRGRSKCTLGSTTKKKLIKIIKDGNNKTKFRNRVDGNIMNIATPKTAGNNRTGGDDCVPYTDYNGDQCVHIYSSTLHIIGAVAYNGYIDHAPHPQSYSAYFKIYGVIESDFPIGFQYLTPDHCANAGDCGWNGEVPGEWWQSIQTLITVDGVWPNKGDFSWFPDITSTSLVTSFDVCPNGKNWTPWVSSIIRIPAHRGGIVKVSLLPTMPEPSPCCIEYKIGTIGVPTGIKGGPPGCQSLPTGHYPYPPYIDNDNNLTPDWSPADVQVITGIDGWPYTVDVPDYIFIEGEWQKKRVHFAQDSVMYPLNEVYPDDNIWPSAYNESLPCPEPCTTTYGFGDTKSAYLRLVMSPVAVDPSQIGRPWPRPWPY